MKAVIPVAGAGTRLRPLTYTQPKPLIPVAGKPIISFLIDQLTSIGVEDFVFIIGYLGEKIRLFLESNYPHLRMTFVEQVERKGSAHALWVAREAFQDAEEIIISFGDVIVDADFAHIVAQPSSCIGVKKVKTPWEFGVVERNEQGQIVRLTEKPGIPRSDMAMVGIYTIKEVDQLIAAIDYNLTHGISTNDEYPLTDALMRMLEQGVHFQPVTLDNWFNCGKKEVLLDTNATFLNRTGYPSNNLPNYDNTIIIHPVSIGPDCQIVNSIIGPYVTIGNDTRIEQCILQDSIIGNFTSIREAILQRSIIGNDTSITGIRQSLNLGDNTEIDFS